MLSQRVRSGLGFGGILSVMFVLLVSAGMVKADGRLFVFTYEALTMPPGGVEYEQWVTWKTNKDTDSEYDRLDFRHELEFGVTEDFQLAIYLSDWTYQDGKSVENDGSVWKDVAIEGIYNLTNPNEDWIGSALYGEVGIGDEKFKLEGKLILQKNIGKFVFAWNGIIEAEWEGEDYHEDKGKFGNTFGASYQVTPAFSLGAELVHEIEYADWADWEDSQVYLGPNVTYRRDNWWVGVAPLFQVTDVESAANFETRLIFGINF